MGDSQRNVEIPFSETIFVSIVRYIKDTCKKLTKFEDFVSINGFLSFDIDGKTQHRFVLNELIDKTSNREGNSFSIGTANWNLLKKQSCSKKENKCNWRKNNNSCSPKILHSEYHEESRPNTINKHLFLNKQTVMQNSQSEVSGPVAYLEFSNGRNKKINTTFTRDNSYKLEITHGTSPQRTISNSTVNLSKCRSINEDCIPHISCSKNFANNPSGLNNHNLNQVSHKSFNIHTALESDKNKTFSVPDISKRARIVGECMPNLLQENMHSKGQNFLKQDISLVKTPEEEVAPIFQTQLLKREDSDVSIGSTRPKYLVHHNGELLLPCPKLGDIIDTEIVVSTVNSANGCQDRNIETPNELPPFNKSINMIDVIVKETEKNISCNLYKDLLDLKDNTSLSSYETNYSTSSIDLELDNGSCSMGILSEKANSTPFILSQQKSSVSQDIRNSLSFQKKKSRRFKFLKIFKKDCHQINK